MKKLKVKNMSNFQMSSHIDANKVFLISYLDLKNRWDPRKVFFNQKYSKSPYKIVTLGRLLQISPQYGANERGVERTSKNQPRYIRITDINTFGELSNDMGVTAENCEQQYFLNHNDLLIARSGNTVGKSYIHNLDKNSQEEFLFAGYMIRFIVNPKIALPLYVFVFTQLSVYKRWVDAIQRVAGQPNINAEEYRSLELPLPALKEQENITNKYTISLVIKQQKEQEAQNLLDSIDDYLMQELGIELPEVDNSLESRVFKTNFSKCQGKRLDSYYHQTKFDLYFKAFKKSVYPVQKLQNITRKITSGITPTSGGEDYVCQTDGIPFIRSGDIEINGDIDLSNLLYISKSIHNTEMKSSQLKENDILIAIVGATIGQVGIYKYQYEANINQAIALVRLKDGYNPNYIKEILKSFVGQINLEHLKRPVARANINLQEISQIQLIIPSSLEKQNQIVAHIQSIREQAKQLQNDAQQQFEEAKKEIERMILGESL